MSRDLRLSVRMACGMALLCAVALSSGCALRSSTFPSYAHSERLYLQDRPYSRLYVEIDRVEGAHFPPYLVEELKAFLGKYCLKPDGIEVVLDPPIPPAEFDGIGVNGASVLCLDGPPDDGKPQPAYFHVFVYDRRTMFKRTMQNNHVASAGGAACMFWNTDFGRSFTDAMRTHILRHELGHMLGLCRNTAHGDGAHCRKYGCLMYHMPDWLSQFGGATHLYFREHRLCEDCERDLLLAREGPPDDGLSFAGPFLIRRTDGYCVASLPLYDTIIDALTPAEFDWRKVLRQAKAGVRQSIQEASENRRHPKVGHTGGWVALYDRPQTETDPEKLKEDIAILSKAVNDPSPRIRRMAAKILKARQQALLAQQ